jgi:hypothetical protein
MSLKERVKRLENVRAGQACQDNIRMVYQILAASSVSNPDEGNPRDIDTKDLDGMSDAELQTLLPFTIEELRIAHHDTSKPWYTPQPPVAEEEPGGRLLALLHRVAENRNARVLAASEPESGADVAKTTNHDERRQW